MYTNPNSSATHNRYNNITTLIEDDFNIIPDDHIIWEGVLPFTTGSEFPTSFIRERANLYKTNESLYKGDRYRDIFKSIVNFNDYMRDAVTNYPILRTVANLPDFGVVTDKWVDLLSAKSPKIDGQDMGKISRVSTLIGASNFAIAFQEAVRGSLFMYGNAVFMIDKQRGGNAKVIQMPIKTWIPLVSKTDPTSIDVNVFFNIYSKPNDIYTGGSPLWFCEFILYHEGGDDAGKVERIVFHYHKETSTLGVLVSHDEDKAFGGAGVSPIVVFTGQRLGNTVYGNDQYRKWEASIVSAMKAYETILILEERTKEIYRVMPEGATIRDENTGVTYAAQTGAMFYETQDDGSGEPGVSIIVPEIRMKEAIDGYKEAVVRVSRDTDLTYTLFDTKELGTQMTGKALKTAMFPTELKAKSLSTLILNSAKQLVIKLALAEGFEIDYSDFTLTAESGFVNDTETLAEIVSKRVKDQPTMSVEDAIASLDGITKAEADNKARVLRGEQPIELEETEVTDAGDVSEVTKLTPTAVSKTDDMHTNRGSAVNEFYPLGGENING